MKEDQGVEMGGQGSVPTQKTSVPLLKRSWGVGGNATHEDSMDTKWQPGQFTKRHIFTTLVGRTICTRSRSATGAPSLISLSPPHPLVPKPTQTWPPTMRELLAGMGMQGEERRAGQGDQNPGLRDTWFSSARRDLRR